MQVRGRVSVFKGFRSGQDEVKKLTCREMNCRHPISMKMVSSP